MLGLCSLYITILLRLLEIHFAKCETTIPGLSKKNSVISVDKPSTLHNEENNTSIMERMSKLESIIIEQKVNFEKYQTESKEEVKVLRNATLLLLALVSGKGNDCQGIKDTASKIKILYSALAAYEPGLNFPRFQEETYPQYDSETSSTEATTTMREYDYKSNDLESRDLVLQYVNEATTLNYPVNYSWYGSTSTGPFSTKIHSSTIFPSTTNISPANMTTSSTKLEVVRPTKKSTKIYKFRTSTHAPINCPRGSKLVGRECFSVHLDLQLNWTLARSFCRKNGGDLAEPNMGNDKLPRQLLKTWPAFKESSYWTLWVGATDQEKEGEWIWVTGGRLNLSGSPRWNIGEPAEEGETQDCLAMILWVPGRWQRWDLLDDPCDLEWFIFCEYSP